MACSFECGAGSASLGQRIYSGPVVCYVQYLGGGAVSSPRLQKHIKIERTCANGASSANGRRRKQSLLLVYMRMGELSKADASSVLFVQAVHLRSALQHLINKNKVKPTNLHSFYMFPHISYIRSTRGWNHRESCALQDVPHASGTGSCRCMVDPDIGHFSLLRA